MKILKIITFFILTTLFLSCDLTENQGCYEITGTDTRSVSAGPLETLVNVPIDFLVTYSVYKDCSTFYVFHESVFEGAKYITANIRYDGCDCQIIEAGLGVTENYRFVADEPGVYLLRFQTTNTTYIERAVTVTAE